MMPGSPCVLASGLDPSLSMELGCTDISLRIWSTVLRRVEAVGRFLCWRVTCACVATLVGACSGTVESDRLASGPATTMPTPRQSGSSDAARMSPTATRAIPTAVRVLTADAEAMVLRPADVPRGFRTSAEYPAVAIELSVSPGRTEVRPNDQVGTGRHMVLVRDDGAAPDGVVSIATSAVRYETTTVATAAFARLASGALAAAPSITLPDETPLGDEVRGWRYRRAAVRVDETILRVRSVVLG